MGSAFLFKCRSRLQNVVCLRIRCTTLYIPHAKDSKESRLAHHHEHLATFYGRRLVKAVRARWIWRYILEHDLVEALIAPRRRRQIAHHRVSGKLFYGCSRRRLLPVGRAAVLRIARPHSCACSTRLRLSQQRLAEPVGGAPAKPWSAGGRAGKSPRRNHCRCR
jgi:hypothetical protein